MAATTTDNTTTAPTGIIRFADRRQSCVWILREYPGWLTVVRGHGWSFGSSAAAHEEALWLSRNYALPIREPTL
jgi:hypothetical protein